MRRFATFSLALTSPEPFPRASSRGAGALGPFAIAGVSGIPMPDTTQTLPVVSFAKLETGMPMPHLLDIQTRAFQALLQPDGRGADRSDLGLERVFKDLFPIQDVNGNYSLEFV